MWCGRHARILDAIRVCRSGLARSALTVNAGSVPAASARELSHCYDTLCRNFLTTRRTQGLALDSGFSSLFFRQRWAFSAPATVYDPRSPIPAEIKGQAAAGLSSRPARWEFTRYTKPRALLRTDLEHVWGPSTSIWQDPASALPRSHRFESSSSSRPEHATGIAAT